MTLKYSTRPLQVILLPLISFTSMLRGLRSHGTRTFRLFMNSPSISRRWKKRRVHGMCRSSTLFALLGVCGTPGNKWERFNSKRWTRTAAILKHWMKWSHAVRRERVCAPRILPSKSGLVATLRPGWGIRKQEMLVKQEWMCLRTFCSSSCWFSEICTGRHGHTGQLSDGC